MTIALNIQHLNYSYRGDWLLNSKHVLTDINLEVNEGESFGFLGHNGAGKTTTIKSILGITKIRSGSIEVFGHSHYSKQSRALIGYLPEHPYFYDHLTVLEMLSMYATLAGIHRQKIKSSCEQALERVNLTSRANSRLRTLSKGLVQRAGMAQAIIAKPKLLILDEPFSGLDPLGRKDFRNLLTQLKSEGTTIFMSSHILSDVEFLCDRVSIMSQGHIKGVFNVHDIPALSSSRFELIVEEKGDDTQDLKSTAIESRYENGKLILVYENSETAYKALSLALAQGRRVDLFSTIQDTLEDVFVRLVQFDEGRGR